MIETDGLAGSFVAVIRDVTEEHRRTQLLLDETVTDPLTGLYNRRGLEQRLEALLTRPAGAPAVQTWIMLDIDLFKRVNDTHGHDAGDAEPACCAGTDNNRSADRADGVAARCGRNRRGAAG